ncbi:Bug family tripartite tricarboxylate transporter substrate binding protein [Ramlibacter rhizophilus]|uniref:Tripartite tricarboxylate transporter substrate binding protein n=1 Tax=Ramlibacter rhizophilus TaxID=1781167 RepID=A0A4Z0BYR8_9BURK|nr:tripartite tricarboxylate transporter substrate binding protein [Ramlibacter rhizophilus]TFZ04393.1 tripartite tricarboxylate transporter substrate binding protein [Ramlibacter rhizophilus]
MKFTRRAALAATLFAAACAPLGTALAQDFPNKPIKLVVGYAAGGPTDVIARIVGQEVSTTLGQPVVVDNRAGANGNIGTEYVARSPADGYTLIVNTLSHNVNPLLNPQVAKYDPVKDFTPVSLAVVLPQLVVVPHDSPYQTLGDLIKAAKADPGKISYGSAGNGGSAHLSAELLAQRAGAKMTHVPFKGNGPALTEVMSGRVNFMFYPMIGVANHVADKKLRILGVTTDKRHPDFPNVPTMAEAGFPGFEEYVGPVGFLAPAGTPAPAVQKLSGAIRAALNKPEVRDRLRGLGAVVVASSPEEYAAWLKGDAQRWAQLIKSAGLKSE